MDHRVNPNNLRAQFFTNDKNDKKLVFNILSSRNTRA